MTLYILYYFPVSKLLVVVQKKIFGMILSNPA